MTMDNDAKAFNDRIICSLAMMVSQYYGKPNNSCQTQAYGKPSNSCQTQAKTLKSMQFFLRTAMSISKTSYTHSESTPVHLLG